MAAAAIGALAERDRHRQRRHDRRAEHAREDHPPRAPPLRGDFPPPAALVGCEERRLGHLGGFNNAPTIPTPISTRTNTDTKLATVTPCSVTDTTVRNAKPAMNTQRDSEDDEASHVGGEGLVRSITGL